MSNLAFAPVPSHCFGMVLGNSSTVEQRTLTAMVSSRFQELSSRGLVYPLTENTREFAPDV